VRQLGLEADWQVLGRKADRLKSPKAGHSRRVMHILKPAIPMQKSGVCIKTAAKSDQRPIKGGRVQNYTRRLKAEVQDSFVKSRSARVT
jgi:hypothetical protein